MVGDKAIYHNPLWYSDEELTDKLDMALLRYKPTYTLTSLPRESMLILCYRTAMDICYELAARNAPFAIMSIEGVTVDKNGVYNNWSSLAATYRELYESEVNGGLGSKGEILIGTLTRQSLTTGREVPYQQVYPLPPVLLSVVDTTGLVVSLSWGVQRDEDFHSNILYRKSGNTGTWTEVATFYNMFETNYEDTLGVAGNFSYKIVSRRGMYINRSANYPFNPALMNYLDTDSNVVNVTVV
jgi:hypothetical protein